jgi:circadian clock protein KaiC
VKTNKGGPQPLTRVSENDFKEFINELNVLLTLVGCTAILLTNLLAEGESYAARTMVDGLIELEDVMDGVRAVRQLIVLKFRGSGYLRGAHFFEIGREGLGIYARVEARLATPSKVPTASSRRKPFGIPGLDAMMGGGPPEGTGTLVLGSSGTGKTIGDPFELQEAVLTGGSMRRRLSPNGKGARGP